MAGEFAFYGFDLARYEASLSQLSELRSTRRLSKDAIAFLSSVADGPRSKSHGTGQAAVARILRRPDLDPRYFLTPDDLSAAFEFVLARKFLEREDPYSFGNGKRDTGVIVEHALLTLMENARWFEALVTGAGDVILPAHPTGESAFSVLPREQLNDLSAAVLAGQSKASAFERVETDALLALAKRIDAKPGWSIAFRALL